MPEDEAKTKDVEKKKSLEEMLNSFYQLAGGPIVVSFLVTSEGHSFAGCLPQNIEDGDEPPGKARTLDIPMKTLPKISNPLWYLG